MGTFTGKSIFVKCLIGAVLLFANQAAFSQLVCQKVGSPIVQTGSLTAADPTQAGRINRNGITGSCPLGKTNAIFNTTPVAQDNYTYTAPMTGCAEVYFDAQACGGASTQMVAYSTYNSASPGNNIISDFGFSTTGVASFSFPVTSGQNFTLVVHDILESPTNLFCTSYNFKLIYRASCQQPGFDRSNDGIADLALFRPSTLGLWFNTPATGGSTETRQFGQTGDIPVAADYNGDGQTDLAVYRPSTNNWYYSTNQTTPNLGFVGVQWGTSGDVPVVGDYDGDGKTDVAIWRPGDGRYWLFRSSDSTFDSRQWGRSGDTPVPADVDGDHRTDFIIVRPDQAGETNLVWYMLQSNFDYGFPIFARWGLPGDVPVPADYDGNGKADIAIFRPNGGLWVPLFSDAQNAPGTTSQILQWGASTDIPQPADYDGDMKADLAVFRQGNQTWYIRNSSNGLATIRTFGAPGDIPATAPIPFATVP